MRNLKPAIICLVKTKTDPNHSLCFCNKFARAWEWTAIPAYGFSVGIIVLWSRSLGLVTPVAVTHMSLNLVISSKEGPWILLIIYNFYGTLSLTLLPPVSHGSLLGILIQSFLIKTSKGEVPDLTLISPVSLTLLLIAIILWILVL